MIQRESDGYVNASELVRQSSKDSVNDYLKTQKTKDFIEALASRLDIPGKSLVHLGQGGRRPQDTWVHPVIALDMARWLGVENSIEANLWILVKVKQLPFQEFAKKALIEDAAVSKDVASALTFLAKGDGFGFADELAMDHVKNNGRLRREVQDLDYRVSTYECRIELTDDAIDGFTQELQQHLLPEQRDMFFHLKNKWFGKKSRYSDAQSQIDHYWAVRREMVRAHALPEIGSSHD